MSGRLIRININPDAQRKLQLEFTAVERMAIATTVTCHGTVAPPALRSQVLEHAQYLERDGIVAAIASTCIVPSPCAVAGSMPAARRPRATVMPITTSRYRIHSASRGDGSKTTCTSGAAQ